VVGQAALERMAAKDGATQVSFKRYMGTDQASWAATLSAEELSALVLASLRDDVAAQTGKCRPRR
jgi:molecular chaperone HscC